MESRVSECKARTCLTDSAISGPIPSPGKRVATIGWVAEEKALAAARRVGVAGEEVGFERLPRARLNSWDAMTGSSQFAQSNERERERERENVD